MTVIGNVIILAALGPMAFPQTPVSPAHAAGYPNQCISVAGVAHIHEDEQRSGTDVDVMADKVTFRGFIPMGNQKQFPSLDRREGEAVVITGLVRMAHNRPEMQLFDASQLKAARDARPGSLRCPAAF